MLDIAILAAYFKLLSQKGLFREYRLSIMVKREKLEFKIRC